jgi:hypothetical protein
MTTETEMTPSPAEVAPASENGAVARCCYALTRAQQAAEANGRGRAAALLFGTEAYRNAMPQLSGAHNIRDFIACVAHGILIRAIPASEASSLLYAAQVAQASLKEKNTAK